MADDVVTDWSPETRRRIGQQLSSLGKLGFFIQLALLAVPVLSALYLLLLSRTAQGAGQIGFSNLISIASTLVMLFTTYWFYRYMRLGQRIRDPGEPAPRSAALSTLWVGLWAGALGILLSLLLLLAATWRMLYVLLTNPQTGMLIAPNLGGTNPSYTLSAVDAVSLMTNIVNLGAELVVLGLTLWLLYRLTWPSGAKAREAPLAR
jgi:hypothetical protein